jgi:hypothetical protein
VLNPGFIILPRVLSIKKGLQLPFNLLANNQLLFIRSTSTGATSETTFLAGYFTAFSTLLGSVSVLGITTGATWNFVHCQDLFGEV